MNLSNKNIREQRTARTARLKSKADTTTRQVQQFNQKYFEIPLPPHHQTHPHLGHQSAQTNPTKNSLENLNPREFDQRKENIKQKIKFRVKQELWNMLKKNNQKLSPSKDITPESPEKIKVSQSVAFVMGKTSTKFTRNCHSSRRNYIPSPSKRKEKLSEKEEEQNLKCSQVKSTGHRRAWSSVKMKQQDRAWIEKNQARVNKSAVFLQKVQTFKIEPWKFSEEAESQELM